MNNDYSNCSVTLGFRASQLTRAEKAKAWLETRFPNADVKIEKHSRPAPALFVSKARGKPEIWVCGIDENGEKPTDHNEAMFRLARNALDNFLKAEK